MGERHKQAISFRRHSYTYRLVIAKRCDLCQRFNLLCFYHRCHYNSKASKK